MTQYARDEFDQVPESSARQGVHRTVAGPVRRRLWPVMTAGIIALLMGLAAYFIFPTLGFGPVAAPAAVSDSPTETPAATQAPASSASTEPEPTPAATVDQPSAEPEPTPSETPASIDKTQPVAVYNATGVAGLAGQVGGIVESNGWSLGDVGNWGGAAQQTSVIFYAGPEQLANAQALAALLGVPTVVDSAEFQLPLVVVVGPGYR